MGFLDTISNLFSNPSGADDGTWVGDGGYIFDGNNSYGSTNAVDSNGFSGSSGGKIPEQSNEWVGDNGYVFNGTPGFGSLPSELPQLNTDYMGKYQSNLDSKGGLRGWQSAYRDYYNARGGIQDNGPSNWGTTSDPWLYNFINEPEDVDTEGAHLVDYGVTTKENIESPYITRDELQSQADALGMDSVIEWMKANNIYQEPNSKNRLPNEIYSKRDLVEDAGYVPYEDPNRPINSNNFFGQYMQYNPQWVSAYGENIANKLASAVAGARSSMANWDVDLGKGKKAKGKDVDEAIKGALDSMLSDPNNFKLGLIDINGQNINQDEADEIISASNDPSDTSWYIADNGDGTLSVYDGSELLWREGVNGYTPYVEKAEDMPQPKYVISADNSFTYNTLKDDALSRSWATIGDDTVTGDSYWDLTDNPEILARLLSLQGKDVSQDAIWEAQESAGKNTEYGIGNINGPEYLRPNLFSSDFLRTAIDGMLSSAPYMQPHWLAANATAQTGSQTKGVNPQSMRLTGNVPTYEPTNDWIVGSVMTPMANLGEMAIGSVGTPIGTGLIEAPLEKLAGKAIEKSNALRYGITKDPISSNVVSAGNLSGTGSLKFSDSSGNEIVDYLAKRLAPSTLSEGIEEPITGIGWELAEAGGPAGMYAPGAYNEDGSEMYDEYGRRVPDTDATFIERFADYAGDPSGLALDVGLGSLLGLGMTGLGDLSKRRRRG